ncbi:MAG: calcium-binding protein [Cyanobacteria bacterium]|nr:calcium-binding protein [Cyanobacteriota bacterium]
MAVTSSSNDLLAALLPEWQRLLQAWSASGALTAAAQEALLLQAEPEPLKRLVSQWSQGDFSGLPPIVLLPASSMAGAAGAYASSTGTIYLNQDWLATASAAQAMAVLTEELGHYLDGLLNAVDTPGDEGELFARLLAGEKLSTTDLVALRTQADQTQLVVNGQSIAAEAAINLTPPRPGGDNPETLTGTPGDDLIDGFGGDDTISGLAGDDILIGGTGNDSIDGGTGSNRLYGDAGDDSITSSGTGDVVDAGEGNNTIAITSVAVGGTYTSGAGTDAYTIRTGATGSFSITSGAGNDAFTIESGINADITINAGDGLNTLTARHISAATVMGQPAVGSGVAVAASQSA